MSTQKVDNSLNRTVCLCYEASTWHCSTQCIKPKLLAQKIFGLFVFWMKSRDQRGSRSKQTTVNRRCLRTLALPISQCLWELYRLRLPVRLRPICCHDRVRFRLLFSVFMCSCRSELTNASNSFKAIPATVNSKGASCGICARNGQDRKR